MAVPQWKKRPWRCKAYGKFVITLPCALTGQYANEYMGVDPHHEPEKGNSGISTKASDERQVPIIHALHVRMESQGNSRESVYAEYGKDPEQIIRDTQEAWFAKFHSRPWEDKCR